MVSITLDRVKCYGVEISFDGVGFNFEVEARIDGSYEP